MKLLNKHIMSIGPGLTHHNNFILSIIIKAHSVSIILIVLELFVR